MQGLACALHAVRGAYWQHSLTRCRSPPRRRASRRRQYLEDELGEAFDLPGADGLTRQARGPQAWDLRKGWQWREVGERIAYRYFCWR